MGRENLIEVCPGGRIMHDSSQVNRKVYQNITYCIHRTIGTSKYSGRCLISGQVKFTNPRFPPPRMLYIFPDLQGSIFSLPKIRISTLNGR